MIAVGWSWIVKEYDRIDNFVDDNWGIVIATLAVAVIIILAVYFVPKLNRGGFLIVILWVIFTLCFAYCWGWLCVQNRDRNYGWYILLLLTAIAIGFALYTL